jgi:hypothetical protein
LEIVMVRRSLDAAKAIRAGNSKSLITSVTMDLFVYATHNHTARYAGQAYLSVSAAR